MEGPGMTEVYCPRCGNLITDDASTCPHCGSEIPEEQRKLLQAMAQPHEHRRIYVYGRPKQRFSREFRVFLILIAASVIILALCRVTHGAGLLLRSTARVPPAGGQSWRGESMMPTYEYRLLQLPEGGTIGRFNEQIRHLVSDGWEPAFMSGDALVNILFRRKAPATEAAPMAEATAIAEAIP